MTLLIAGLLLFIGVHSTRIVADGWRGAQLARLGERRWKAVVSLLSIAGFVMLVWGYGLARAQPVVLWTPPVWGRHLAAPLVLVALMLLAASQVPGNGIKARVHHPLAIGTLIWAGAHLLANGTLADGLLFGSFLAWAALAWRAAHARDRAAGAVYAPGRIGATVATVIAGVGLWALFAAWAHAFLFGVRPLP
jgi:uncharacterized membrane protein